MLLFLIYAGYFAFVFPDLFSHCLPHCSPADHLSWPPVLPGLWICQRTAQAGKLRPERELGVSSPFPPASVMHLCQGRLFPPMWRLLGCPTSASLSLGSGNTLPFLTPSSLVVATVLCSVLARGCLHILQRVSQPCPPLCKEGSLSEASSSELNSVSSWDPG